MNDHKDTDLWRMRMKLGTFGSKGAIIEVYSCVLYRMVVTRKLESLIPAFLSLAKTTAVATELIFGRTTTSTQWESGRP